MLIQSSRRAAPDALPTGRKLKRQPCWCQRYATAAFSPSTRNDPYTVLGLERSAHGDDIKERYYELVKEYHPDRGGQNTPEAKETFSLIMDAYALLRNPTKRAAYLQSGAGWEHGTGPSRMASTSASAAAEAGFHTGRRKAFDERHARAASKEEYERHRAAQEMHFKSRYRWDSDYVGSKPGMKARDLDGIWTPYNAREADSTGRPVATFVAFIILALVVIVNKPRRAYAPNAGSGTKFTLHLDDLAQLCTELYKKSPQAEMAKRLRQAEADGKSLV